MVCPLNAGRAARRRAGAPTDADAKLHDFPVCPEGVRMSAGGLSRPPESGGRPELSRSFLPGSWRAKPFNCPRPRAVSRWSDPMLVTPRPRLGVIHASVCRALHRRRSRCAPPAAGVRRTGGTSQRCDRAPGLRQLAGPAALCTIRRTSDVAIYIFALEPRPHEGCFH